MSIGACCPPKTAPLLVGSAGSAWVDGRAISKIKHTTPNAVILLMVVPISEIV